MSITVVIINVVVEKCCRAVMLVILRRAGLLEGSEEIIGLHSRHSNALNVGENDGRQE